MKHAQKRILSALLAALFLVGSLSVTGFAEDGHTHQYVPVSVVEPGYQAGGSTVYRCACGDSYTEPTSPRAEPYCTVTNGRVSPGEETTVQAHLFSCEGLADLTVDLLYNTQRLQLTGAACAEYGAPIRVTDKALYFGSIDPAVHEAVLELTFLALEDAPTGVQTVTVAGCGVSAIPVDQGEQIVMTSKSASVTVYRPFMLTAEAPDEPIYPGDRIAVNVDLENNPGVSGMILDVQYDPQVLALEEIQTSGMFSAGSVVMSGGHSMVPYRILWDDAANREPHAENGTILTLVFLVQPDAASGETNVTVTSAPGNVLDGQLNAVELLSRGAAFTISRHVAGDVNDDGVTDLRDVTALTRYLAGGWGVDIHARNSDVNGDGTFDLKDAVLIRRYLAGGWKITLL